jgi:hypothetical protein
MFTGQRIIFDSSGTEKDLSADLNDFRSGISVVPFLTATDFIYVGSILPFNHRFIEVTTTNDSTSTVKVEIWYANAWHEAVDVVDRTSASVLIPGDPDAIPDPIPDETRICSLAKSGIISWSTDRLKGWDIEQDSDDVTGISKAGMYDMYWMRFSWNANLKATTALGFIGHKFSTDNDLVAYYPDMAQSSLLTSFEAGKTTWDEQHYGAAEIIVRDLISKQVIASANQVIQWEDYIDASCHKVAEMVYIGLGRAFDENRKMARAQYDAAMNRKHNGLDLDGDGKLSITEKFIQTTGWMRR